MKVSHCLNTLILAVSLVLMPAVWAADEPALLTMPQEMVDINTADAATLAETLEGVGMARAIEIVAYRETHGKFQTVEQLAEVKGIGMATVEKNRDRILIVKN
ncbi:MAG: ComEA family DNA-binding protein [Pseudohongiellaceae bacterium]